MMGRSWSRHTLKVQATSSTTNNASLKLTGPPTHYDHKKQLAAKTLDLIRTSYPQLEDLALSSTLIAIPRPDYYVERRDDGYIEPELIFLLGTAHLSPQSAKDVERLIKAVNPDDVVVELCRSRAPLMYDAPDAQKIDSSTDNDAQSSTPSATSSPNLMALGGNNFIEALQRSMQLGGQGALLLRLLLGGVSSRLSDSVGIQTGAEFRAARAAAQYVGAEVVLGDRPIEITLRRAWEALPLPMRVQLLADLLKGLLVAGGGVELNAAMIDQMNDDDAVSLLLKHLADKYPEALSPLIHERDLYLAWSLSRSKAVNGATCVVGVIGRGHMRGVCYALTHSTGGKLRFKDLAGYRDKAKDRADSLKRFAIETALGVGAVAAWNMLSQ